MGVKIQLFEVCAFRLDFCLWGRMKSEVYKEKVGMLFLSKKLVFIIFFPGVINLPQKRCFTTKYFCIVDKTKHTEYNIVFPLQNGYANAPQCYVIRTLPILSFVVISPHPCLFFSLRNANIRRDPMCSAVILSV